MAAQPVSSMRIKQIIKLFQQGEKIKAIARSCGVSRNSVRYYLRRLNELGIDPEQALKMEDPVLQAKLLNNDGSLDERHAAFLSRSEYFLEELKRRGVTRLLLWEEYRQENPQGYGYSQFCHHLYSHQRIREAVMVQQYLPGEKMEVDFSGDKLRYVDKNTGEVICCDVFVAVLCYSNLIFARAVPNQQLIHVVGSIAKAIDYFGGSPQAIVPDNMRTAVTRSDRYEPRINDAFLDMANYYSMGVLPTRPLKPRDKPKVEKSVSVVYRQVFARLRNKVFGSLHELNLAIVQETDKLNERLMQQYGCSRKQLFEQNEKSSLRPVPLTPYQLRYYLELTVQQSSYVYITRQKKYYSVPFRLISQKVKVVCSEATVVIYFNGDPVATHQVDSTEKYVTQDHHLPSHHRHYLASKNQSQILERGQSIGQEVRAVLEKVLARGRHPEQNYKTCQGILSLERKVGSATLRDACRIALQFGVISLRDIQRLSCGQYANRTPRQPDSSLPSHENIRGLSLFD